MGIDKVGIDKVGIDKVGINPNSYQSCVDRLSLFLSILKQKTMHSVRSITNIPHFQFPVIFLQLFFGGLQAS